MSKPNIEKLLVKKREVIDKLIEKYLPRKITRQYLNFLLSNGDNYNLELLQRTLIDPLWNFLDRGGKRWRPVLFLLVLEALGGNVRRAKDFLIIPELIHEGSLIVDDIEDSSELRRGERCLHHLFGQDVALNAGNFAYFLPLKIFLKKQNGFTPEIFQKAYQAYIQEMVNVSVGQAIDIGWHRDLAFPAEERQYLEMCKQKSGAMVRLAVKLAAIFAGAPDVVVERLAKITEKIAVAFQIQDDILDVELTGRKRSRFGKSFGNDIKEGKKTLMVIYTCQKASPQDKKKLLKILQKHTTDFNEAKEVIELLKKYGAIDYAKEKARQLAKEVEDEIEKLLAGRKRKEVIIAFMKFLIERSY
jgi:geranylgeranyl pyrophosphate synthase